MKRLICFALGHHDWIDCCFERLTRVTRTRRVCRRCGRATPYA